MELLEREDALSTLADYAREARSGNGRMVFVAGEAGIGKTALLEAFQCRTDDARCLWGACDGLITPRPLAPLFDIAAQVGGELADLCDREVVPVPGAILSYGGGGPHCITQQVPAGTFAN